MHAVPHIRFSPVSGVRIVRLMRTVFVFLIVSRAPSCGGIENNRFAREIALYLEFSLARIAHDTWYTGRVYAIQCSRVILSSDLLLES